MALPFVFTSFTFVSADSADRVHRLLMPLQLPLLISFDNLKWEFEDPIITTAYLSLNFLLIILST